MNAREYLCWAVSGLTVVRVSWNVGSLCKSPSMHIFEQHPQVVLAREIAHTETLRGIDDGTVRNNAIRLTLSGERELDVA